MNSPRLTALLIALLSLTTIVSAEEIRYGTGTWEAESLGNHRAVVQVEAKADAVRVYIPWRRSDARPEKKEVLIVDAAAGAVLKNVVRLNVNTEFGDFIFQPVTAFPATVEIGASRRERGLGLIRVPFLSSSFSFIPSRDRDGSSAR